MDSAAEDILLQKIEELVLDEDQIVTISILCEKLNINLQEAKLLLEKYVADQVMSPGKISVSYLICGIMKTGDYGIHITEATLLKETKKKFSNITNEIVYSIQKNNNIDFNLIAIVENTAHENSKAPTLNGSIISDKCIECKRRVKELPPVPLQKNFEKQKPSSFFKPVPKPKISGNAEKSTSKQHSVKTDIKNENHKLGGLANFFSQASKNEIKKENSSGDEVEHPKKLKMENEKREINKEVEELNEEKMERSRKNHFNSESNDESHLHNKNGKLLTDKKTPNKEPRTRKKDDGRKRKRIIIESDSDDDLFGNNEDEKMVLQESDDEQVVVKKTQIPIVSVPKNKRRKAIEKTYEDEEGYIVTRTEYVLVSASEDEDDKKLEPQKIPEMSVDIVKTEHKEEKKLSVAKVAPKKKGKTLAPNQSSIMNFFKKK